MQRAESGFFSNISRILNIPTKEGVAFQNLYDKIFSAYIVLCYLYIVQSNAQSPQNVTNDEKLITQHLQSCNYSRFKSINFAIVLM